MPLNKKGYGPIGQLAHPPVDLLVCFAVKEEAKFFLPHPAHRGEDSDSFQAWITGMGRKNAADGIREAIAQLKPERVVTAGFAGGLNPRLKFGTIVYDQDFDAGFEKELKELGAVPAKFYCHRRVAITTAEKAQLWKETGADAVEMESSVIRTICREFKIPSATVRVISDDATQDLPLDFNALMTSDDRINFPKLIWKVLSHPGKIPKLMEFQRETVTAAKNLGKLLEGLLGAERR